MDSTLISIECVDEIAAMAGRKAEVAAITEAAMRGEIADYKESLRRRVALLKGVRASDLQRVYDERLRFNPGAETLVAACRAAGLKTLLVSGGFTFFTDRVRERLGIDFARSNVLEHRGRRDSPAAWSTSPGATSATAKRRRRCCSRPAPRSGIAPARAIAVGDGANDLPMMSVAGLSVAYPRQAQGPRRGQRGDRQRRPRPAARSLRRRRRPHPRLTTRVAQSTPTTRRRTSSPIASDDVSPGDSMPNSCTTPGQPCSAGPAMWKSAAAAPRPESFGRTPV